MKIALKVNKAEFYRYRDMITSALKYVLCWEKTLKVLLIIMTCFLYGCDSERSNEKEQDAKLNPYEFSPYERQHMESIKRYRTKQYGKKINN